MNILPLAALFSAFFVNSAQDSWVDKLANQNGNVCCYNYDGLRLEDPDWETQHSSSGSEYKVIRNGVWLDVPAWAVVTMKNQDGIARVWYYTQPDDTGNQIRCFLPGALS